MSKIMFKTYNSELIQVFLYTYKVWRNMWRNYVFQLFTLLEIHFSMNRLLTSIAELKLMFYFGKRNTVYCNNIRDGLLG